MSDDWIDGWWASLDREQKAEIHLMVCSEFKQRLNPVYITDEGVKPLSEVKLTPEEQAEYDEMVKHIEVSRWSAR